MNKFEENKKLIQDYGRALATKPSEYNLNIQFQLDQLERVSGKEHMLKIKKLAADNVKYFPYSFTDLLITSRQMIEKGYSIDKVQEYLEKYR